MDNIESSPEDQIEMMLMMHMDKLQKFPAECTDDNTPLMDINQPAIQFMNQPPTHQEVSAMDFLSNSSGRWGNEEFGAESHTQNSMAAMREMIFRIAAMQPIQIDPETVKPPKRRNVKISKDPQSVAARHRRERISERIRILQRLVPGGTKMDTASMLDEAIHYVKFLKNQIQSLERVAANGQPEIGFPVPMSMSTGSYLPIMTTRNYQPTHNVQNYGDS